MGGRHGGTCGSESGGHDVSGGGGEVGLHGGAEEAVVHVWAAAKVGRKGGLGWWWEKA